MIIKYNIKSFYFFVLIIVSSLNCNGLVDVRYPIYLRNNATHTIGSYFAVGDRPGPTMYPDTTLPEEKSFNYNFIAAKEEALIYDGSVPWKELFSKLALDTLSVFIFHKDTVEKYSWEEIRTNYMVLERYDLSLEDLKECDFEITYP